MKKQFSALAAAVCCSVAIAAAQPQTANAPAKHAQAHAMRAQMPKQQTDPKLSEVNIAKRVAELKVRLSLSDKQASEMTKVLTKAHAERVKQAEAQRAAAEKARQDAQAHRAKVQKEIDGILTAEQKAEYDKMSPQRPAVNKRGVPLRGMVRNGGGMRGGKPNAACCECGGAQAIHHKNMQTKGRNKRMAGHGPAMERATPTTEAQSAESK